MQKLTKVKNFILSLKFIFKPSYWLMNNPYNREYDLLLSRMLESYDFTDFDGYTAKLGPYLIWTANHPYASMTLYSLLSYNVDNVRASRLTIEKAHNKLIQDKIKSIQKLADNHESNS